MATRHRLRGSPLRSEAEIRLARYYDEAPSEHQGYIEWMRFRIRMLLDDYDAAKKSAQALEALGEPLDPKSRQNLERLLEKHGGSIDPYTYQADQ